jgi:hypothetical protein
VSCFLLSLARITRQKQEKQEKQKWIIIKNKTKARKQQQKTFFSPSFLYSQFIEMETTLREPFLREYTPEEDSMKKMALKMMGKVDGNKKRKKKKKKKKKEKKKRWRWRKADQEEEEEE